MNVQAAAQTSRMLACVPAAAPCSFPPAASCCPILWHAGLQQSGVQGFGHIHYLHQLLGRKLCFSTAPGCVGPCLLCTPCTLNPTLHALQGLTALHMASHQGHSTVVSRLARTPGVEVNAADNKQRTALHHAAALGMDSVVMELWARGAEIEPVDVHGATGEWKRSVGNQHKRGSQQVFHFCLPLVVSSISAQGSITAPASPGGVVAMLACRFNRGPREFLLAPLHNVAPATHAHVVLRHLSCPGTARGCSGVLCCLFWGSSPQALSSPNVLKFDKLCPVCSPPPCS